MEMRKVIVQAKKEHINDIYQLLCILEDKQLDKKSFEKNYLNGLENRDIYYYIYVKDEKVIGFMSFYIHHYLHHDGNTGEIVELVVDPQYRGQKVGNQLIEYVKNLARELSLEEIELSTSTYRKRAHRFYEAHGFIMNHYNYIKKLK